MRSLNLAMDSFIVGTNTRNDTLHVSDSIVEKYFEVEDLTFEILLKYQPLAQDFRFVRSSIEISYAFQRFGRYAYDITQVRDSFGDIRHCKNDKLMESFMLVQRMMKEAIFSFATLDVQKAWRIREREDMVDTIYRERLPYLVHSTDTQCALVEALLLRYLERIADHALFMSDAITYIVTGKHQHRVIHNGAKGNA